MQNSARFEKLITCNFFVDHLIGLLFVLDHHIFIPFSIFVHLINYTDRAVHYLFIGHRVSQSQRPADSCRYVFVFRSACRMAERVSTEEALKNQIFPPPSWRFSWSKCSCMIFVYTGGLLSIDAKDLKADNHETSCVGDDVMMTLDDWLIDWLVFKALPTTQAKAFSGHLAQL